MVDLPSSFSEYVPDPSDRPQTEFTLLPPGTYIAHAIEAKKREFDPMDSRANTNFELNVTFEILDGQFQNRKLWHTFVLQSQSQGQMKVGTQQLAALFDAFGHAGPRSSFEPALFKPVKINVKAFPAGTVEPGRNGKPDFTYQKDTNKIAGFYPVNQPAQQQRSAPVQPTYQQPQQPAYQAPQPSGVQQQPQRPAQPGVPSWLARKG